MREKSRWGSHAVLLGALAGLIMGGAYLLLSGTLEEEGDNLVNMAHQESDWGAPSASFEPPAEVVAFQFDSPQVTSLMEDELDSDIPASGWQLAESAPLASPLAQLDEVEAKLLAADAHHYTVQLVGAKDEEKVKQFIAQHQLEGIHYFRTQREGKDWYVVLQGEYPSLQAAQAAIDKLPATLKQADTPWVRELQSVQSEIKERMAGRTP